MRAFCWALAGLGSAVQAAIPLAVEDADLLPLHQCEAELGAERLRGSGLPKAAVTDLRAGCTFWSHTQINLAWTRQREADETDDAASVYGKTRLISRADEGWGLTLAWELERARRAEAGRHWRYAGAAAVLSRAWDEERWWLHINAGLGRDRVTQQNRRFWSAGLEYSPADSHDWILETYGAQGERPSLGLGLRAYVGEDWSLGVMWARQRSGPTGLGAWLRWTF
ncbi:hypothetical protein HNQ51_002574 [Inhella inkyongensis]|uniref:Cellulose biosynthesis protein BcsS n=1 Tax=Inhella inkyongensis TaxID=392593 RepID=A0A840S4F7_9BURK|nr:hypothetical protein [Inhella inkyongensis]MBB5205255.1 hypothetical protein [Inhella inkyongensis]